METREIYVDNPRISVFSSQINMTHYTVWHDGIRECIREFAIQLYNIKLTWEILGSILVVVGSIV